MARLCEFPGCDRKRDGVRFCKGHCQQVRNERPMTPFRPMRSPGTPPVIIYDEVPCDNPALKGPCHVFRGFKNRGGYGESSLNSKPCLVHRYVWERDVGPIPPGMFIDHQCRNRACCNVDHLRVVTPKQNSLENSIGPIAKHAAKTHCFRGHEFTEENTLICRKRRHCRKCSRIRAGLSI